MKTHLVDSDWTIDFLNGRRDIVTRLSEVVATGTVATSIISVGEVREGFVGHQVGLARYDSFLSSIEVLAIDLGLTTTYAELRSSLRKSGMLMSDNDTWIAATALHHDLTLISRDKAFDRVPNLKLMR